MTEGIMKTTKRISTASLLAAASLTFAPPAWSLGLGDITVESFLNQPLQVKIDLISRETDDLTAVTARLASADDYALIGASLESVPVPIRFTVEDIEGDAYVLGVSNLPIGEPVVRLIVEVNWSSGRLLREYTVFLDPLTLSEPAPVPRIDQRKIAAPVAPAAQPEPSATAVEPAAPAPEAGKEAVSSTPREPVAGEYGPVASGETLWSIASNWSRGTGLSVNQVMIAIQRENPQAFLKDNINLLKRGSILRMPRIEDVRAISRATAISEVSAQAEEFRSGSGGGSAVSPSTPLLASEAAAPESESNFLQLEADVQEKAAEKEAEVTEAAAEAAIEAEDEAEAVIEAAEEELLSEEMAAEEPEYPAQLELVPPSEDSELDSAYGFEESEEEAADASVAVSALRENLARTEEELITQQQQNEYLAERIKELEAQLASAEEGNVDDADMANMEDRLRQQRLAEAAKTSGEETPWYGRFSTWLIGLIVIALAAVGWRWSRRGAEDEFAAIDEEEQLREIKDEAEEVLRVLKDSAVPAAESEAEAEAEEEAEDRAEPEQKPKQPAARSFGSGTGDARVLDEESSDPEIQLDLARAYISMGDKEAARVILDEVVNNGTEEQAEEARKMLTHLTP